jgi:hypothetical protein
MPDWSIKIVAGEHPEDPAKFIVDRDDVPPGDPLVVAPNDIVCWNNTTDDTHQPWPAALPQPGQPGVPLPDSKVLPRGSEYYLSDPIPRNSSSRPSWIVTDTTPVSTPSGQLTMYYCCLLHPEEQGQIIINTD